MIRSKLHPNTKVAWRIVFVTLLAAAGVASLLYFSPNSESERIAFASFDGNDFEIFTSNPDGSNLVQLTDNYVDDWGATWSPDRTQIAFRSGNETRSYIYLMDADGSNMRVASACSFSVGNPFYQGTLTWSPDGTHLAYAANFNGNWDIWMTRLEDGQLTRLTSHMSDDLHPDWSPNGDEIAFNRYDSDGLLEIFTINVNDASVEQITHTTNGMVMYPRWSPSGDEIVYFVNDGVSADLFMMDADGTNVRQLTTDTAVDRVGVFSPDGNSIVFRSERDGDSDIYTMNLDNGRIRAVTTNDTMDMAPDW